MRKSINQFVFAVTFLTPGITAHAGNPVDENGMPFESRFISGNHFSLNFPDRQEHFTCPVPESVEGTQFYRRVVFIPCN